MAIYYNKSAPVGYGVDETGHFVKIPAGYVQQGSQFVAPSASQPVSQPVQQNTPQTPTYQPSVQTQQSSFQQSGSPSLPPGFQVVQIPKVWNGNVGSSGAYIDDQNAFQQIQQDYENLQNVGTPNNPIYIGYKIPTTTVVSPNGQRVTVRTDNKTGRYRTLAEMVGQGFQPEKAPGISSFNTQERGNGTVDLGARPDLVLPTGQRISGQDPNYEAYKNQAGVSQIAKPASSFVGGHGIDQGDTQGSIPGVDTTGWSPSFIQAYGALADQVKTLQNQGKIVNPSITITPEITAKYLEQAKTELNPYYSQVIKQAQDDIQKSLTRTSEDYASRERNIGLEYGRNLESTQENFARRGLEFSSTRDKEEKDLASQATTALEDAQRQAQRQAQDIGTQGERQLGSSLFGNTNASITTGATPIQGRAGVYGLQAGTGTRNLFTPTGGVTGEIERRKLFDEKSRVQELTTNEREYRGINTL